MRLLAARVLATLAIAATSLVMFGSTPAHACSCALGTPQEYVKHADRVFVGTVTSTDGGPKDGVVSYEVEVDRVFKGQVDRETSVVTASMDSMCGLPGLPENEPLLFFATSEATGLSVTSCGGTAEVQPGNLKAVRVALGEPRQPTPVVVDERDDMRDNSDPGPDLWPWPAAAGAGLLALGGGLLLRRRRSA